jgi:uncharacterized repeat protein (TIGR01451 family)
MLRFAKAPRRRTSRSFADRVRTLALLLVLFVAVAVPVPAAAFAKSIEDISPDVSDSGNANASTGGRSNGVASVPGDNQTYYSATEWGGLYKSANGGASWVHLDGHLPQAMWDVKVDPGNAGTVYATSFFDGRASTLAGINVSYDAGATWIHPSTANPGPGSSCTGGITNEPSAYDISIRPDATQNVFVGTNCGVARSTDFGATWTFLDVDPGADPNPASERVWGVVVHPGGAQTTADVCGDDGYYRSTDGGANWTLAASAPPAGRCHLDRSPDENYVLFSSAPDGNIWESDDGGANWTNLGTPDQSGRIPFLVVNDRAGNAFDLWFGDLGLSRGGCTTPAAPAPGGATRCPTAPGAGWVTGFTQNTGAPGTAHDDAGDLVFDTEAATDACPTVFSSDGGVHVNTNLGGGCQNPVWARSNVGHHAIWLFGMAGADRAGATAEDLYGGAQDNGAYGTTSAGASPPTWTNPQCCDVFDFVADANRAVWTFCCTGGSGPRTVLRRAAPGLGGITGVTIPPSGLYPEFRPVDIIDQFGLDDYVVLTRDCTPGGTGGNRGCPAAPNNDGGVWVTDDITAGPTWTELPEGTGPNSAQMCGVQASQSAGTTVFYLQVGSCFGNGGDQLWKYFGTAPGGTWTRIDTNPGFGGSLGLFAVDPNNANRLYGSAVNGLNTQMVFSNNGGLTWQTDAKLTMLMGGNGDFPISNQQGPTNFTGFGGYVQPTLIAFDPEDPNVIAAGGHDSGVFLSTNGGDSWVLMTDPRSPHTSGVPHLPQPRFAHFDHESPVTLFVGTQGRGFWRLVPSEADLSITKTDTPDPVNAGEQLYYDITVTNNGPDDAQDVTVFDDLPSEVDYVTDTDACIEDPPESGNLICDLGDIPAGESRTFRIKVAVHSDVVANAEKPTKITNTASVVSGGAVDPDPTNNQAVQVTIVEDLADLEVTKLCKPDDLLPAGEVATCTIFVDNHGPSDARDVVVDNVILSDGEFSIANVQASQGSCDPPVPVTGGQRLVCALGDLAAASSAEPGRATITYEVTATEPADINDVATARSDTPDPDHTNNQAQESFAVTGVADLSITKGDAPDPVVAGTSLTYTLEVTNHGPSTAHNVVITDNVPAGVSVDSVSATGASSCAAGAPGDPFQPTTCKFDSLAPSASRTMTIEVTVAPRTTGRLHNDARVSSDTFDPDNSDDLATAATDVTTQADLTLTKSDSPDPVVAGTPLDYELVLTNNGPSTARNVTITDDLPAAVDFVSATISNGTGVCEKVVGMPNTVQCELNDLDPAQHVTVIIHTTVRSDTPDGSISNSATASSDAGDPVPANNTGITQSTTVQTRADVAVVNASDADIYKPSSTIQYIVTITDHGPSDAQNVSLIYTLPPAKDGDYEFDTGGCTLAPDQITLTCPFGTLAAGETRSINIYWRVKGNKGVLTTTAVVTSTTTDPIPSNNTSVRQVLVKGGV